MERKVITVKPEKQFFKLTNYAKEFTHEIGKSGLLNILWSWRIVQELRCYL